MVLLPNTRVPETPTVLTRPMCLMRSLSQVESKWFFIQYQGTLICYDLCSNNLDFSLRTNKLLGSMRVTSY